MVKAIKKNLLIIVLLILSIILPLIWLPNDYVYLSEEDNFANYQNVVYRNANAWSASLNGGGPAHPSDHSVILPNGIFYYALSAFHLPNYIIQKIFLTSVLILTFFSVAFFLSFFTKNSLIILIGILFYYFNFYVKSTLFYSAKMYQLILLPLFFVFTYNYLKSRNKKYAVYNFFALFLFQAIFSNLATLVATLIIYPIAICSYYVEREKNILSILKEDILRLLFFFSLITPIFLYQSLVYYFSFLGSSNFNVIKAAQSFSALSSPIDLILQLRGSWWEFVSFGKNSYNSWLWFYNNPFLVFGSIFLFIVIVLPLLKTLKDRTYFFWFIFFIVSVILASGASFYQPLYRWFYVHIPFFYIFREPWAKFTPLIIFSFMTLLVLSLKHFSNKYLIWACLFFIVLRAYPFFTTDFFERKTERWYIPFTKTPSYWNSYEKWSLKHRNENILLIPVNYFKRNWYREDIGNANHPYARLFGYTNIYYSIANSNLGYLIGYFISQNNPNFIKITSIDSALFQNDIDMDSKDYTDDIKTYSKILKKYFIAKPTQVFENKLSVHKIKPGQSPPIIFSPKSILISKNIHNLSKIVVHPEFDFYTTIYLLDQNKDKLLTSVSIRNKDRLVTNSAKLSFRKINQVKYLITLQNARDTSAIVFNQNYHKEWKLFTTFSHNLIDDKSHFIANGYANSWIIDINKLCRSKFTCNQNPDGSYQVDFTIEYVPQFLFTALQLAILVFAFILLIYIIFINIREKDRV